jgi:hypothetical protein
VRHCRVRKPKFFFVTFVDFCESFGSKQKQTKGEKEGIKIKIRIKIRRGYAKNAA